ncbi:hypothetical protein [Alicyclobacillus suci]|uniref:hypothetical protein n=1 Tax=Alicyclobacillus suci TaxID=2816080 RepID=UPI001A8ED221|nr:hypothetical protein [Alicyclobacillus suci]
MRESNRMALLRTSSRLGLTGHPTGERVLQAEVIETLAPSPRRGFGQIPLGVDRNPKSSV